MNDRKATDCVIWDFNGTLINDLDLVVRTVNIQLAKRSLPPLTTDDYRNVFGFPVEDYYRRIGVTFENETIDDLSADFFADYSPALKDCSLHDHTLEALRYVDEQGIRQFVLSAMEQGMLRSMIDHLNIDALFEAIYGLAHQKGDSKIIRAQELVRDFNIDPASALFVGDTDHDAEVAQALGMSVVLVATGHQSAQRLRETGYPVFESYKDLLQSGFPS